MLTNKITLQLTSDRVDKKISVVVRDRSNTIVSLQPFTEQIKVLDFNIVFPNSLFIDIYNDQPQPMLIELTGLKLSGLSLPIRILDQICQFKSRPQENHVITRKWHSEGLVQIDFFAPDWIQYHLLYQNKIELNNQ